MCVRVLIRREREPAVSVGLIRLAHATLVAEPPQSKLLNDILQTPIDVSVGGQPHTLDAETEPARFLAHLHQAYPGPYVTVTPVEASCLSGAEAGSEA